MVQIEFVIKMSLSVNILSNNFITVSWIFFLTSTTVVQIEIVIKMSLSVNTLSNCFMTAKVTYPKPLILKFNLKFLVSGSLWGHLVLTMWHKQAHTHTHTHAHTRTRAHAHTRTRAHAHAHTHTHIYIYIYIAQYKWGLYMLHEHSCLFKISAEQKMELFEYIQVSVTILY